MTRRTGMRPLRIAMIGQKGIPARYGGVETHVENISRRLVERGHTVWAYGRSRFRPDPETEDLLDGYRIEGGVHTYHGVQLAYRPCINSKHLDAATHAFFCALESGAMHGFDIVHFHGIGPSAFAPVAKLFGRKVVSTFHALDWRQVKWGDKAKRNLKRGESVGAKKSDGVIAVSRIMEQYILGEHGVKATYIPNGATIGEPRGRGSISRWGLDGDDYVLTVGRIIPDRELHTLINAFNRVDNGVKLVIVGSETPRSDYSENLKRIAGENVIFTGDLFGDDLEDLYANCLFYVLASRVEGLPITVCEAMAHGRACLLSDIPENAEVGGDAAQFFKCTDSNSLYDGLKALLSDKDLRTTLGEKSLERARTIYNWDLITDQVESFYYRILQGEEA